MQSRNRPSTSDNLVVIGLIFTGMWLLIEYGDVFPIKITFDGVLGQLWTAWIVISSLMLSVGIIIKIINR